jgi:hypothetical protein
MVYFLSRVPVRWRVLRVGAAKRCAQGGLEKDSGCRDDAAAAVIPSAAGASELLRPSRGCPEGLVQAPLRGWGRAAAGGFRCNADFARVLPSNAGVAPKAARFGQERRRAGVQDSLSSPHGQLPPGSRRRALLLSAYCRCEGQPPRAAAAPSSNARAADEA